MAKHPPTTSHNYVPKLAAFVQSLGPVGDVLNVRTLHDNWCDAVNGVGFCNCDPEFEDISPPGARNASRN